MGTQLKSGVEKVFVDMPIPGKYRAEVVTTTERRLRGMKRGKERWEEVEVTKVLNFRPKTQRQSAYIRTGPSSYRKEESVQIRRVNPERSLNKLSALLRKRQPEYRAYLRWYKEVAREIKYMCLGRYGTRLAMQKVLRDEEPEATPVTEAGLRDRNWAEARRAAKKLQKERGLQLRMAT
jgi:hypothetical protein